jgi:release factor H-coupled RctB family protein
LRLPELLSKWMFPMGNSERDAGTASERPAPIHTFYSASSWIEGAAVDQLKTVAAMGGVMAVAAFPDLHPGKFGPVGSAILSDRIHTHLIGNDIGCGMTLFALDLPARKLRLDKASGKLRALEGPWDGPVSERLEENDLAEDQHSSGLGTIGGGNHFCEVQMISEVLDDADLAALGLDKGGLVLLVHSGSRSLGASVFSAFSADHTGLDPASETAQDYLAEHDKAVAFARLNRQIIAERAAEALRTDLRLISDAPHNLIERHGDAFLHRKGAAKADEGPVPLAGSRDTLSYLVRPTGSDPASLSSLAHGSGRKYDRGSMTGRAGMKKSERNALERTSFGGYVVCEDRQLLIEEAPIAYKPSTQVLDDLVTARLAMPIAALTPLLTFKKAKQEVPENRGRTWARPKARRHRR